MKNKGLLLAITSLALLLFTGCSDNTAQLESGNQQEKSSQSMSPEKNSVQSSSATAASTKNSSDTANKQISLQEAIAVYRKEKPNTDITGIEIKSRLNKLIYEIEGMDANKEYKYYISETGEVQTKDEKTLDEDDRGEDERNKEKLSFENLLPLDKINAIAKKEVDGNIVEWSLERELSKTLWEVKVEKNGRQTDISIDAQSGNVLEIDEDD